SFFPEGKERMIKEIMERTNYSYERINSALKSLTKKRIIKEQKKGKTLLYTLDMYNINAELGFGNYMITKELAFREKHKILEKAIKELITESFKSPFIQIAILFGSYSKGIESKQSDIDLMLVSDKKQEAERIVKSLRHKYNLKFAPVIINYLEFPKIRKDNPELWNDLKMYGIVFKGEDSFYYWMYNA
ncbi:MAG: nucleotidyltransferase domain-containing protein, partial [DPANN group archaeon]|nr:nucleotidyltransferase domain-containing protein [DPANN group archaeon]